MAKAKRIFICGQCGAEHAQWQGQCADCGAWNSLSEGITGSDRSRQTHLAGQIELSRLDAIQFDRIARMTSGLSELDRVLGGGLVPGSVVLIGGDPGIGKSTLLLRVLAALAADRRVCYVTGEESLDQIAMRAERLGVRATPVDLIAETHVERIVDTDHVGRIRAGDTGLWIALIGERETYPKRQHPAAQHSTRCGAYP
ncbi:MAG: ATPase domain-containing protein, partial [Gammaproteobacteria bacterium]